MAFDPFAPAGRLGTGCAAARVDRGRTLLGERRIDEAVAALQAAVVQCPEDPRAHTNLGEALLLSGDLPAGFAELEWRFRDPAAPPWWATLPGPLWDGQPLPPGTTLLLHAEQGLADTIQFARYAPLLAASGQRVLLLCQPPLCRLLRTLEGVDAVFPLGDPRLPPFDAHAPLMSLPHLLGATLAAIPASVPYLYAEPRLIRRWREERAAAAAAGTLNVGVAWEGCGDHAHDAQRWIPPAHFAPLAEIPGVRLLCLRDEAGRDQIAGFPGSDRVFNLAERRGAVGDEGAWFVDTASIMTHLDLVVTGDTVLAHLAGALGVPCWVALEFAADWRWLTDRADSPWYPTLRLFRQAAPGDWAGVFRTIATQLSAAAASGKQRPPPIRVEVGPGELLDRLSILRLKAGHAPDAVAARRIADQARVLEAIVGDIAPPTALLFDTWAAALAKVNAALWEAEDGLRACERRGDVGQRFVSLARSIGRLNDRRAQLKRAVDRLLRTNHEPPKLYPQADATE
jgi:hypothetical protein